MGMPGNGGTMHCYELALLCLGDWLAAPSLGDWLAVPSEDKCTQSMLACFFGCRKRAAQAPSCGALIYDELFQGLWIAKEGDGPSLA